METLDNDLKYVGNLTLLDKHEKILSRNLLNSMASSFIKIQPGNNSVNKTELLTLDHPTSPLNCL